MKNSVTICIGTINSPTFEKCKNIVDLIAINDARVKRVVVIRDKSPQSAWLNDMRFSCKDTKWCLQVDEDMYLHKNALSVLVDFACNKEREGIKILSASSLLYDCFLQRNIGSLKLWSSSALQAQEFRDVLGGDRDYAARAKKNGFKNVEISRVLGDHDSAPNEDIAYKKYFEYVNKLKKFKSEPSAARFVDGLRSKYFKDKSNISKAAYFGASDGLISALLNKSKNNNFKENYLYQIFSINDPKEAFSSSNNIFKKLIKNNKKNQIKLIIDTLKMRKEASGEFLEKKAYDGAAKAIKNFYNNSI